MSSKQHIIELNGNRYNTVTGAMVNNHSSTASSAGTPSHNKSQSVDGFTRSSRSVARTHNPSATHKTQKSQTLMRKIVQKPVTPLIQGVTSSIAKTNELIQTSKSFSAAKLTQAKAIPQSNLIRRFNNDFAVPKHIAKGHATVASPQIARLQTMATATTVTTSPLTRGLAEATSHEEVKSKKPRHHVRIAHKLRISPRTLSTSSFIVAALLVAGFFTYQNMPNLSMRLASSRAGVRGTLPSYQPAGFGLSGSITYKPGQITVGYKSHSDDRNFKIIQSASSWDSTSLLDNFVATSHKDYQTVLDRGKTIYIYDKSSATWMDGGVWYRVEGNSELNSDQLLNLASSL